MSDGSDDGGGPLASSVRATELGRALRDVLTALASAERADRLLHLALERAGRARFPSTPSKLRDFVHGDLAEVVAEALGADAIAIVVARVEPVLGALEGATRITRSTAPAPRARGGRSLALLSDDPLLPVELGESLSRELEIELPTSATELRALVRDGRCVVLLDLRLGISPALARLGPALAGARVVAWGDDEMVLRRVRAWCTTLLAFPSDDTPHDLAAVLGAELEGS